MRLVSRRIKKNFLSIFTKSKTLKLPALVLIVFGVGFLFAWYFFAKSFPGEEISEEFAVEQEKIIDQQAKVNFVGQNEIPLPEGRQISGYIQSQFINLDNDKGKEAVAIYYDSGGEDNLYKVFFVIFKLEGNRWNKLIERQLESFSPPDKEQSLTEIDKTMSQFQLADLTTNGIEDVLVKTRTEGSGEFLEILVYGLKNNKIDLLFSQGPIPKGNAGVEEDRLWLIAPLYQSDDPNCCPSFWIKTWWQWQDDNFSQIGEFKGSDFKEVEKANYSSLL